MLRGDDAGTRDGMRLLDGLEDCAPGQHHHGIAFATRYLSRACLRGAAAHCATFMRGQSELVVARNEAVYNYSVEDKGGALAISGDKLCLCSGTFYFSDFSPVLT